MPGKKRLLCLIIVIAVAWMIDCKTNAEESGSMSCPDMSTHTKVLDEGLEKIKSLPGPEENADRRVRRLPVIETTGINTWTSLSNESALTDQELKELQLHTYTEMEFAEHQASLLELDKHFDDAQSLLEKVLKAERSQSQIDHQSIANTLRHLARLQIEKGIGTRKPMEIISTNHLLRGLLKGYGSGLNAYDSKLDVLPCMEEILDKGIDKENPHWDAALNLYGEARKESDYSGVKQPVIAEYAVLLEITGKFAEARKEYMAGSRDYDYGSNGLELAMVKFCDRQDDVKLARSLEIHLLATESPTASTLLRSHLVHSHISDAVTMFDLATKAFGSDSHWTKCFNQDDIAILTQFLPLSSKPQLITYLDYCFFFEKFTPQTEYLLDATSTHWPGFAWEFFESISEQFLQLNDLQSLTSLGHYFAKKGQGSEATSVYTKVMSSLTNPLEPDLARKNRLCSNLLDSVNKDSVGKTADGAALTERIVRLKAKCEERLEIEQCISISQKLDATGSKLELSENYHEAERMYRESFQIKEKHLGINDGETLQTLNDLARVVGCQGKVIEATSLYERSLWAYRKHLIPKDTLYARLLDSYGQCLANNKQTKNADLVYDEARAYHASLAANK